MNIKTRVGRVLVIVLAVTAIGPSAQSMRPAPLDAIAERYVKLVLALGEHDADYVDAYYGPAEWRSEMERRTMTLDEIAAEAARALTSVGEPPAMEQDDELVVLRHQYLRRQLESLAARVRILGGTRLSFDEESRALYDAVAPVNPEGEFEAALQEIDELLPGAGPLLERYDAFVEDFVIPPDRLGEVFDAAIAECRRRTRDHLDLPSGESFTVEYVTDKPWSGYNWYQGDYRSLIQVNTDLPIYIDRAIDLACHEGYPGHHTYNVLLEKHLVRDRGWLEMSVTALFSPHALVSEGTANFGIEVAFPGDERVTYEREVLFPLAGLDASRVEEYYGLYALREGLVYAGNEAARRYLNGEIDREGAAAWLARYAMMSPARANQRVRFIDRYRSYVINYNLGNDLVRRFIESQGGTDDDPGKRWEVFAQLLASPRLPSGLQLQ